MAAVGAARRRPTVAMRRARALRLRQEGHSYAEIAAELRLPTEAHARTDVSRAMTDVVREAGQELVELERDRYDRLQALAWRLAEDGDTRAIRELVRIFERRAKLLGLDKAAASQHSADELDAMRQSLGNAFLAYAANPPETA